MIREDAVVGCLGRDFLLKAFLQTDHVAGVMDRDFLLYQADRGFARLLLPHNPRCALVVEGPTLGLPDR